MNSGSGKRNRMTEEKVTKIRIGGNLVGIAGLDEAMAKAAESCAGRPDGEIRDELLRALSGRNYIPARARDLYGEALLREFKRFLGQPVGDEPAGGIRVAVLGPGCARCSQLEIDVREVMAEMHLPGELLHITDYREIASFGVKGVPALVINGRVVSIGATPHRKQIREWLAEAAGAKAGA